MAFFVYILECADGSYYTGHTDRLEYRMAQHEAGEGSDWTRRRLPVQLLWSETFSSREEALSAEQTIKGWSRAKKKALMAGRFDLLSYFAKPPSERPSTSPGTSG
ncbi:GIY-YIG nuclease family protein [Sphingomicrobium sp. XHP0235]|uniref:GIY-YIG nuclease family protein n=1 Tax=Sphingomicrobium aquimarinum TaxID=3133971 RepID=UPI0031FF2C0A